MERYVLTATHFGQTAAHIIKAIDATDATFQAIYWILDKAHAEKYGPWAKGHIKLIDPNGDILHEMPA